MAKKGYVGAPNETVEVIHLGDPHWCNNHRCTLRCHIRYWRKKGYALKDVADRLGIPMRIAKKYKNEIWDYPPNKQPSYWERVNFKWGF